MDVKKKLMEIENEYSEMFERHEVCNAEGEMPKNKQDLKGTPLEDFLNKAEAILNEKEGKLIMIPPFDTCNCDFTRMYFVAAWLCNGEIGMEYLMLKSA